MKKKKEVEIIYEDDNVLAINKPTGISVHGDGKTEEYTIADWILKNYPELEKIGEPIIMSDGREILRPGIVHRLDKDTSGIMIIAKNETTYEGTKRQFQDRKVKKVYMAITHGKFADDNGLIDKPIGRSANDFRAKSTGSRAKGEKRDAMTYFRVLERFPDFTLLELRPKTGRTHQIRVHLKSISRPIVCDEIYGKGTVCPKWMNRLALHAQSLEITLPGGDKRKLIAPLPSDFSKAVNHLRK